MRTAITPIPGGPAAVRRVLVMHTRILIAPAILLRKPILQRCQASQVQSSHETAQKSCCQSGCCSAKPKCPTQSTCKTDTKASSQAKSAEANSQQARVPALAESAPTANCDGLCLLCTARTLTTDRVISPPVVTGLSQATERVRIVSYDATSEVLLSANLTRGPPMLFKLV